MKQRLFLYRVNVGRTNLVIIQRIQDAVYIFPHPAMTESAVGYQTPPRTQSALHLFIFCREFPQNRSLQIHFHICNYTPVFTVSQDFLLTKYDSFDKFVEYNYYMLIFKKWRRNKTASRPFPWDWLAIIEENVPLYQKLSDADRKELQRHILIFLSEKRFEGCGGLEITDEIKLTITAQACILLLHRQTDYYPGLHSILVYPNAYVANRIEHLAAGVVAEGPEVRLGESWHRGSVVLSWDDVQSSAADAASTHNVVFHEFAHQIDTTFGEGDDTPILQRSSAYRTWSRILQKEYQRFCDDVEDNRYTVLDSYGATNPAEFFAVATEFFFQQPQLLRQHYPDLYNELKVFYQFSAL